MIKQGKMKVKLKQDLKSVQNALATLGAKCQGTFEFEEHYYILPGGILNFLKNHEVICLRLVKVNGILKRSYLIYRGGRKQKTPEKLMVRVSDPGALGQIFGKLEIRRIFTVNRWQERYIYPIQGGEIVINLENIENVKEIFLNIRLPKLSVLDGSEVERFLQTFLKQFGSIQYNLVRDPYIKLIAETLYTGKYLGSYGPGEVIF